LIFARLKISNLLNELFEIREKIIGVGLIDVFASKVPPAIPVDATPSPYHLI